MRLFRVFSVLVCLTSSSELLLFFHIRRDLKPRDGMSLTGPLPKPSSSTLWIGTFVSCLEESFRGLPFPLWQSR